MSAHQAAEPAARRPGRPPSPRALAAALLLIPLLAATALWAFAWPAARIAPNDLPIGVAGPAQATAPLTERLEERDGAFDVEHFADRAEAVAALEDREIYAALVAGPEPELLLASAGSPAVAEVMRQAVTGALPEGTAPTVTDVVPAPPRDPRGIAFAASVLPLALTGIAIGSVTTMLGLRGGRAVLALLTATALTGMVGATLLHGWLDVLEGNWWTVAGVFMLGALAVAATSSGVASVLGARGIALSALTMVFFGNPFSGANVAPELLPDPVGMLGQFLPPGASAMLMRSVSFFDGSGGGFPLLVLACWLTLGLSLLFLGGRRAARRGPAADRSPAGAPLPQPTGSHA
ncbi:ABC transporter permease [Streptomyces aidingensis]|uniref:ABC-2 family transporter protein n=1 Tax=Streptomyces aidingensis TaxID=910347 RepID=A0A1I1GXT6_9ACTN|nr:ABC transporter permease [Streptomyces aidingensis]SFC16296.1 hypothetical protein SAMN05421773_102168 [Streptomyces aidingensis]